MHDIGTHMKASAVVGAGAVLGMVVLGPFYGGGGAHATTPWSGGAGATSVASTACRMAARGPSGNATETAVRMDPRLTEPQKRSLLAV